MLPKDKICHSMMQNYLSSNNNYEKNVSEDEKIVTSLFFARTSVIWVLTKVLFVTFCEVTW